VGFALLNPPDANEKIPHAPFGRKGCGCHWRGRGPEGRARRHLRQGAGGRGRQGRAADTKDCASVAAAIAAEGGTAHAVLADVRDAKSVGAMIAEAERKFGRLDILVNNPAIGSNIPPIAIEEIDTALWDEFMTVNVPARFSA
jgi:NAD(P)-dependent dehydrogenase (short-subunit alcohol dehydrogenase family)